MLHYLSLFLKVVAATLTFYPNAYVDHNKKLEAIPWKLTS